MTRAEAGGAGLRRLLYLTPYFPPLARVGALRPLKFARHLPAHGWAPVVLCDLWPGAKVDPDLLDAVPATTTVVRRWSRRAAPTWQALLSAPPPVARPPRPRSTWQDRLPEALTNPELLPLGEHSPRIPWNLRQARELLDTHACEAILVNADPYAACLVGMRLSKERGLPLLVDLRDPWALCELRRPRRPAPQRWLVDRMEAAVVAHASAVILNTEAALADYRDRYGPSAPLHCIRNSLDAELIAGGEHAGFERFTLLFLGNFGRFIWPDVLLEALASLRRRGVPPEAVQLVVTGHFPEESWVLARRLGVDAQVVHHPHVPYREIGAIMDAADALVLLIQPGGRQRFAAKFFDYLGADRPIIAISDNAELDTVLAETGAGASYGHGDVEGLAGHVASLVAAGRHPTAPRRIEAHRAETAAGQLAALLARATS